MTDWTGVSKSEDHPFGDLIAFQDEHSEWSVRNFGDQEFWVGAIGKSEEVGELCEAVTALVMLSEVVQASGRLDHALLKRQQGIRGTSEELDAKAQDAVGDIVVYLTSLCNQMGWVLADIMERTWGEVKGRDWQANPDNGEV